jgi:hypothetical protein
VAIRPPNAFRHNFSDTSLKPRVPADGNENNIVKTADYTLWRDNFGRNEPSGPSVGANAAVPEPAARTLMIAGLFGLFMLRRFHRR